MEPRPDLDQGGEPAADFDPAGGRRRDAGEQLQEGALARAVRSDHAERFAADHVERQVAKRPEHFRAALPGGARRILLRDVV